MTDRETRPIYCYSSTDDKVFVYNFTDKQITSFAEDYADEIFFELTGEESLEYFPEQPVDNLKNDFIYYKPRASGRCIMLCTCENFLESDDPTDAGISRLAKKAVRHARKTGHTLNPRGN